MRPSLKAVLGLFFSATLVGCGASATIPEPPSQPTNGPPPGTSPEMAKVKSALGSGIGPANPGKAAKPGGLAKPGIPAKK